MLSNKIKETKKNNIYLMDKGISAMPENADILEIGSFAGQSAIIMNYLMKKHNKKGKIIMFFITMSCLISRFVSRIGP